MHGTPCRLAGWLFAEPRRTTQRLPAPPVCSFSKWFLEGPYFYFGGKQIQSRMHAFEWAGRQASKHRLGRVPVTSRMFGHEPTTKRKYMQVTNHSGAVCSHDGGVWCRLRDDLLQRLGNVAFLSEPSRGKSVEPGCPSAALGSGGGPRRAGDRAIPQQMKLFGRIGNKDHLAK